MKTAALLAASATLLTLPGCLIVADNDSSSYHGSSYNQIDRHEMEALVAANREAQLGMGKAEALGLYPDDLTTLKSSGLDGEHTIETWKVSAVTRNGDVSFTRWLYFYNDQLVELRDDRINWDDEHHLATWRTR